MPLTIKHQTRLSLSYGGGLRSKEAVALRVNDPDVDFAEQKPGTHPSDRNAEKIFHAALNKAGISLEARFHTLHHKPANSTEIYTHISGEALRQISSPLDKDAEISNDAPANAISDKELSGRWHHGIKRGKGVRI